MNRDLLRSALSQTLDTTEFSFLGPKTVGKVRDTYRFEDNLILVTTDRLSAFDRILGLVPYKGQVLNQLAAFWFEQTRDIVANHVIAVPDPNVTVGIPCRPLPVEVVVRGYISGVTKTALWYRYSQGERTIYGIDFPDGLAKNEALPAPVITPTTKGGPDGHDERITRAARSSESSGRQVTTWRVIVRSTSTVGLRSSAARRTREGTVPSRSLC